MTKNYSKTSKTIYTMIFVALFTGLCFIGATYIQIPMLGAKVHLGNFFCVLGGLLCGGIVGGLSGSLGMGLSDIYCGYDQSTIIRTFVLKFLMGYIVGALFRFLLKKEAPVSGLMLSIVIVFAIIFTSSLTIYLLSGGNPIEFTSIVNGKEKVFEFVMPLMVPIFSGIYFACGLTGLFFIYKLNYVHQALLFSLTICLLVNLLGEYFLRVILSISMGGYTVQAAFIYSLTKIPANLFTSIITTIFVLVIYTPLYLGTRKFNKFNDVYLDVKDLTTFKKENGLKEPKK